MLCSIGSSSHFLASSARMQETTPLLVKQQFTVDLRFLISKASTRTEIGENCNRVLSVPGTCPSPRHRRQHEHLPLT